MTNCYKCGKINASEKSLDDHLQICLDHLEDYFELTGRTLLEDTDEVVEATHSKVRIFEERHGYKQNKKGTPNHKVKHHKSSVHFNSLNLGDF